MSIFPVTPVTPASPASHPVSTRSAWINANRDELMALEPDVRHALTNMAYKDLSKAAYLLVRMTQEREALAADEKQENHREYWFSGAGEPLMKGKVPANMTVEILVKYNEQ